MVWPFTRLVHAWSVPVAYLRREPIVYRSRAPRNVRAGAAGIGAGASNLNEGSVHVRP
jgi:nitrate reductase gamma subunit